MKYKLLYFAFGSDSLGGVEQKIIAQCDFMSELGVDVNLYLVNSYPPDITLASEVAKRSYISILNNSPQKIRNPWARRREKFEILSSVLKKFDPKSTLVYFRYPIADFLFLRFLKKNKGFLFITEHQEIETRLKIRIFKYSEILFGKAVRRQITGFVGVTIEITNFERSLAGDNVHYYKTIGNGIQVNKYPVRSPEKRCRNNEIHILFVGSGFAHHGLSRLIRSIANYYKDKNNLDTIKVKIAGDCMDMKYSRRLVINLKLSSSICFEGNLKMESLNELFNWAHVGMGSMGLHKIGLNKSSTLKAREYFARGLPFFWSSSDDDFPHNYPFMLQFEANDSCFDIKTVISFAKKVTQDETHPYKMRQYSAEYLDWRIKIKELVTFFDEVIASVK